MTDTEIQRTNGVEAVSLVPEDFAGSAAWFTGLAVENNGTMWTGTWSQFSSSGSTLIKYNPQSLETTIWSYDNGWPFPGEHVRPLTVSPDGRIWMVYDSESPSLEAGILAYDGVNIETFPSAPGGFPAWDMLPNANIKDVELVETDNGYELWLSCLGRGIAVLSVVEGVLSFNEINGEDTDDQITVFPSPATDQTKIEFRNETSGYTSVRVFDMTGKKIVDLYNGEMSSGRQVITWNPKSIATIADGVYFIQVMNGGKCSNAKIVIK
jgi:hypothetical protein